MKKIIITLLLCLISSPVFAEFKLPQTRWFNSDSKDEFTDEVGWSTTGSTRAENGRSLMAGLGCPIINGRSLRRAHMMALGDSVKVSAEKHQKVLGVLHYRVDKGTPKTLPVVINTTKQLWTFRLTEPDEIKQFAQILLSGKSAVFRVEANSFMSNTFKLNLEQGAVLIRETLKKCGF